MKKLISLTLILVFAFLTLTSCGHKAPKFSEIDFSSFDDIEKFTESDKSTDYVLLDIADFGKIVIRLYPDVAPKTVKHFKSLVAEGFYDGLIFHRIIEDFMVQGGDPTGTGLGSEDQKTISGEFNENNFINNLHHVKGVVSMARKSKPLDSATSQFFICTKETASLNGKYAAFGFVVFGMDVLDKLNVVKTDANDKPVETVTITSAKFVKLAD